MEDCRPSVFNDNAENTNQMKIEDAKRLYAIGGESKARCSKLFKAIRFDSKCNCV